MINRVILVGRLTRNPELRKTNTGNAVCSFTVAVDNRTKNPDDTRGTSYIPCVAFQQTADNMTRFLKQGSLVGVEGRLNQRKYQRQDGSNATVIEVLCDNVQFLEPKSKTASSDTTNEKDNVSSTSEEEAPETLDLDDEPLPFE